MKYLYGNSDAAIMLEEIVSKESSVVSAKVMRHLSDYNHYVNVISKLEDRKVKVKALDAYLECDLDVSQEIKNFIRNVKIAKRRQMLENIG